jgi:hypothetical protein
MSNDAQLMARTDEDLSDQQSNPARTAHVFAQVEYILKKHIPRDCHNVLEDVLLEGLAEVIKVWEGPQDGPGAIEILRSDNNNYYKVAATQNRLARRLDPSRERGHANIKHCGTFWFENKLAAERWITKQLRSHQSSYGKQWYEHISLKAIEHIIRLCPHRQLSKSDRKNLRLD